MKLKDILHEEIDFDTHLARETEKHMLGDGSEPETKNFEVKFELYDDGGNVIKIAKSSDAPTYPDTVEIKVTDIDDEYETPKFKLTSSSKASLNKWLETRSDYSSIEDYIFDDINIEEETGTVTASAVE